MNQHDFENAIARARRFSPFLSGLLDREPDIAGDLSKALQDPLDFCARPDEAPVARRLRIERRRLALLVALGDLSGAYPLERVTGILSDFADHALDTAIRTAMLERTPDDEPRGLTAIALGKHGSRELNYSSDIDPILLFDPATLPLRPREVPEEAAVRIGRRVVELLQARDADGYVLRVDLRLRPSPEVTAIVLPVAAAISHYESQALPWERAAFIRSRVAAGDMALGNDFLNAIQSFIWRRSLDFGTIGELREITRRIRQHHSEGQRFGPGYDLKRGRGGIREIEFYTQIHQLIHGGRDPGLRVGATWDALGRLRDAGWIDADIAASLSDAYRQLRTIEHRLQMIDDRQTHSLPEQADALENVAHLADFADADRLLAMLAPHVAAVAKAYDALEGESEPALPIDAEALAARLATAGFDAPDNGARIVAGWRASTYPALRSAAAQAALEAALPGLIAAMAAAADPNAALVRLDAVLARLPSAINFFRLLEAHPALARLLSAILCHAPTLAEMLARRVELLDGLIDATALEEVASVAVLTDEMWFDGDYQAQLDHVRRVVNEKRFALGAQIIAGTSDPLRVSTGYARVAEAAIETLAAAAQAEFARRHGAVPGSELVILALGRLGGAALTHASDLDLIYIFTGDFHDESDGEKPLGATLYYNRLAQRITGALSVSTAAGPLYEVDTRLRPQGAQGPIAVSLEAFATYQRESAWTWEHMALTRARPVYGSAAARKAVMQVVDEVLCGNRPDRDVRSDAVTMRDEMAAHKPPAGPFDAKLGSGGLVDLEFAVHVQQLCHRTGFDPHLGRAIDALTGDGLLPPALRDAHDFLTRLLVTLRLVAPDAQMPALATQALVARAMDLPDWDAVVASFDRNRQEVAATWTRLSREGE